MVWINEPWLQATYFGEAELANSYADGQQAAELAVSPLLSKSAELWWVG